MAQDRLVVTYRVTTSPPVQTRREPAEQMSLLPGPISRRESGATLQRRPTARSKTNLYADRLKDDLQPPAGPAPCPSARHTLQQRLPAADPEAASDTTTPPPDNSRKPVPLEKSSPQVTRRICTR
ncbi:hypothetical protein ACQPXS_47300 (plasmid) [Streptomyces sp. CA-142005]|uniref:hypothetical protein n=1 Tax=Streptomyces sp. CA-142005 TaxID=3240052 RepID=UPI003D8C6118